MKSQNNKIEFISKFKYLMIIPMVICIAAIVIGAIFGFNKDYDFRTISSFNVKLGTTITEQEYEVIEDSLYTIVKEGKFDSYKVERVGEGAKNGFTIKIANDDSKFDVAIDELKVKIEDKLFDSVKDDIDSSVVISTTEV